MARRSRTDKQLTRIHPGSGRPIRPFRPWDILFRTVFLARLPETTTDEPVDFALEVNYLADYLSSDEEKAGRQTPQAALFRDGRQQYVSNLPAAFPVPGGVIEAATNLYGLTRMHFVPHSGPERALTPHPRSAEGLRARLGRRFPATSRAIGVIAIIVLLACLALSVPQVLELVSHWQVVQERFGVFDSPVSLPAWANITMVVAGILAATERALTLRNHWLIDADTLWTSFI